MTTQTKRKTIIILIVVVLLALLFFFPPLISRTILLPKSMVKLNDNVSNYNNFSDIGYLKNDYKDTLFFTGLVGCTDVDKRVFLSPYLFTVKNDKNQLVLFDSSLGKYRTKSDFSIPDFSFENADYFVESEYLYPVFEARKSSLYEFYDPISEKPTAMEVEIIKRALNGEMEGIDIPRLEIGERSNYRYVRAYAKDMPIYYVLGGVFEYDGKKYFSKGFIENDLIKDCYAVDNK